MIRALDASTWDVFARLAEKTTDGFGGCWCTWFRLRVGRPEGKWAARGRSVSFARGTLSRPRIQRRRCGGLGPVRLSGGASEHPSPEVYEATRAEESPGSRVTCIFVDRDYRRKGVAGAPSVGPST